MEVLEIENGELAAASEADTTQPGKANIERTLRELFPPLTRHERVPLRRLIQEGEATPRVVVWAGKGIVVDGRETLRICQELGIPFDTEERDFADIEDVIRWRIETQLGRRNLTMLAASYYRGKLYLTMKQQGRRTDLTSCQSGEKRTDELVGKLFGVGARTISRDAKLCKALDSIAEKQAGEVLDPVFPDGFVLGVTYRSSVLSGRIRPTRGEIITTARMRPGEMARAIKDDLEAKKKPRRTTPDPATKPEVTPTPAPTQQDATPTPPVTAAARPGGCEEGNGNAATPAPRTGSAPTPTEGASAPAVPPSPAAATVVALTSGCQGSYTDSDSPSSRTEPEPDPEAINEDGLAQINRDWNRLNPATQLAFLTQDAVTKRVCEAGFFRTVYPGTEGGAA